jgi:hypothetical protein
MCLSHGQWLQNAHSYSVDMKSHPMSWALLCGFPPLCVINCYLANPLQLRRLKMRTAHLLGSVSSQVGLTWLAIGVGMEAVKPFSMSLTQAACALVTSGSSGEQ